MPTAAERFRSKRKTQCASPLSFSFFSQRSSPFRRMRETAAIRTSPMTMVEPSFARPRMAGKLMRWSICRSFPAMRSRPAAAGASRSAWPMATSSPSTAPPQSFSNRFSIRTTAIPIKRSSSSAPVTSPSSAMKRRATCCASTRRTPATPPASRRSMPSKRIQRARTA